MSKRFRLEYHKQVPKFLQNILQKNTEKEKAKEINKGKRPYQPDEQPICVNIDDFKDEIEKGSFVKIEDEEKDLHPFLSNLSSIQKIEDKSSQIYSGKSSLTFKSKSFIESLDNQFPNSKKNKNDGHYTLDSVVLPSDSGEINDDTSNKPIKYQKSNKLKSNTSHIQNQKKISQKKIKLSFMDEL